MGQEHSLPTGKHQVFLLSRVLENGLSSTPWTAQECNREVSIRCSFWQEFLRMVCLALWGQLRSIDSTLGISLMFYQSYYLFYITTP